MNPHLFSFPTPSTLWGVTSPPWGLKLFGVFFGVITLFIHNTQMDRVHKHIYSITCGIKISQLVEIRKIMFKKSPGGRGETENKDTEKLYSFQPSLYLACSRYSVNTSRMKSRENRALLKKPPVCACFIMMSHMGFVLFCFPLEARESFEGGRKGSLASSFALLQ